MQNFSLDRKQVLVAHFNPRSEVAGDERRPAADIKIECVITPDELVHFGSTLRSCFYDDANRLRNPKLQGPFAYDHEIIGASFVIHHGLGGKSDLSIGDCVVNKFALDPKDGGTIMLSLRVQCHPDEKASGKLCGMVQTQQEVTLQPVQATLPGLDTTESTAAAVH